MIKLKKNLSKKEIEKNIKSTIGFSKKDITVEHQENTLTIKSVPSESKTEEEYVHQGISKRNFTRTFTVADDVVVKGASLKDGMLSVELERIIPEEKKLKVIDIK